MPFYGGFGPPPGFGPPGGNYIDLRSLSDKCYDIHMRCQLCEQFKNPVCGQSCLGLYSISTCVQSFYLDIIFPRYELLLS